MREGSINLDEEQARTEDTVRALAESFVPLPVAAALTFHAAHRNTRAILTRDDYDDALNMAAAALSRLAPVFRVEDPRHGRTKVAVNLATDRFARGATELRRGQGGALRDLSVRHGDLQSAVMLVKQAGLSFTFALSPQAPAVDENQETPTRPR